MQSRNEFIRQLSLLSGLLFFAPLTGSALVDKKKKIILRSSWQTINIGDIGHTPGVLTLLEKYLPDVEVMLWPIDLRHGVEEMLMRRFPKLKLVKGEAAVKAAFATCDFLLHGSGPSLVAYKDVNRWKNETGKPYGVYGITFPGYYVAPGQPVPAPVLDTALLSSASFAFFRDSVSLEFAKKNGVTCPVMEFGPDGAFGVDLRNEETGGAFLKKNGLVKGQFLCCIPRQRYTPDWEIPGKNPKVDEFKVARNNEMREHDNAPLREAIIQVTRKTKMKVLICPEDSSQVSLGKTAIYDLLPADVKQRVVWRDSFWLTDEALSIYTQSAGLFGLEMHSPIMCVGNGIPAIVCRFYEQSSKGMMWKDIGLGNWLFDMDSEEDVKRIVPTVLELALHPKRAKEHVLKAQKFVQQRQRETMAILQKSLPI